MSIDLATDPRYAWWRLSLEGKAPEAVVDDPQPGYYWIGKGAERQPVAIYPNEYDEMAGSRGFHAGEGPTIGGPDFVATLWPSVYSHPITDAVYWDTIDNGRWADLDGIVAPRETPVASGEMGGNVMIGHNRPPLEPFDEISDEVENAIDALDAILPEDGMVRSKEVADHIANSRDRLRELWKKADAARVAEKKPHDDASAAVQNKWRPIVDKDEGAIAKAAKKAGALVDGYLKWAQAEQDRIAREERERAREEQRKRDEEHAKAVAEAKAAEAPEPPAPEPVEVVAPPEPVRVGGGYSGRRTGLKEGTRRAEVEDWDALINHLKNHAEVREVCQKIANAAARSAAKVALPGCKVVSGETIT